MKICSELQLVCAGRNKSRRGCEAISPGRENPKAKSNYPVHCVSACCCDLHAVHCCFQSDFLLMGTILSMSGSSTAHCKVHVVQIKCHDPCHFENKQACVLQDDCQYYTNNSKRAAYGHVSMVESQYIATAKHHAHVEVSYDIKGPPCLLSINLTMLLQGNNMCCETQLLACRPTTIRTHSRCCTRAPCSNDILSYIYTWRGCQR